MPGETAFTMNDPEAAPERRQDQEGSGRRWYSNVWDGVDRADQQDR